MGVENLRDIRRPRMLGTPGTVRGMADTLCSASGQKKPRANKFPKRCPILWADPESRALANRRRAAFQPNKPSVKQCYASYKLHDR